MEKSTPLIPVRELKPPLEYCTPLAILTVYNCTVGDMSFEIGHVKTPGGSKKEAYLFPALNYIAWKTAQQMRDNAYGIRNRLAGEGGPP